MTKNDGSYRKINDISDYIYNMAIITSTGIDENGVKQKQKDWSDASVFCTGRMVTSPCDTPTKDSGPLSPECIVFLWNNEGSKKIWTGQSDPIGPTYYTSDSISLFKQGAISRACQASGTLSPINVDGTQKKDMISYWQGMGGIDNVKQLMANLHRAANAQAVADDELAPYFKQCYGDITFASRPPTIPESQRQTPPPASSSAPPPASSAPPPVYLPPPPASSSAPPPAKPASSTGYFLVRGSESGKRIKDGTNIIGELPVTKIIPGSILRSAIDGRKKVTYYLAQDGKYVKSAMVIDSRPSFYWDSIKKEHPIIPEFHDESYVFSGNLSNITDQESFLKQEKQGEDDVIWMEPDRDGFGTWSRTERNYRLKKPDGTIVTSKWANKANGYI